MTKILCIVGPTAVGKSSIAIELAKKLDTEIISLDAYQIYKGMDIGTAKTSVQDRQGIKHNLIDIIEPYENFNSMLFKQMTAIEINRISSQNKIPILVGGTGFYLRSLLYPMDFESSNTDIRKNLQLFLLQNGKQALFDKLVSIDKATAETLTINDTVRVMRAIEIYQSTGKKKSEGEHSKNELYSNVIFGLNLDRATLYDRINNRVAEMMNNGLVDEVKLLLNKVDRSAQSMQGIGYKETISYLNNECTLAECVDLIKQHTRNYAKRQLTYFKTQLNTSWIDMEMQKDRIIDDIITKYNEK